MILTPTEARRDLLRSPALRRVLRAHRYDPDVVAGLSAERIRETLECTSIGIGVSIGMSASLGAGSSWTPPATASLEQWFKPSNWDTASGEISQWHDSSGSSRHGTQGTGSQQPTATTDGGRVAARFVAANSDHLKADGLASVVSGTDQPFSFAFLARRVSGEGTAWGFGNSGSSSPNMQMQIPRIGGSGEYRLFKRDDAGTSKDSLTSSETSDTSWHYYVVTNSGTAWSMRKDGAAVALGSSDSDVAAVTFDRFTFGAHQLNGSPANFSDILFHNWLFWSVVLDAGQIAAVETELASR